MLPSIPLYEESLISYSKALDFISNKLLNRNIRTYNIDDLINEYFDHYKELSEGILITEIYHIYNDCKELLVESDNPSNEYTDDNFEYNGFIKSDFVIHEHDSKRAPLHWDLRFKTEFKTSAFSFVLLKHKMPEDQERLLVKRQPMHPTQWVDMDHTQIGEGYGQGSVTTVDRGIIYYKMKDNSFTFYLKGNIYQGAYHLININQSMYLLFKATNSILADLTGRLNEWIRYAYNFILYLNKTFKKKFNLQLDLFSYRLEDIKISENNKYYFDINNNKDNNILYIPSISDCLDIKKNLLNRIISTDCKINNIEDVMRLLILRNYISPEFFRYISTYFNNDKFIDIVYNGIRDIDYNDQELNELKVTNYSEYMIQKIYRMFSDIYLGHKFYGQFDFERFLINLIVYKKGLK